MAELLKTTSYGKGRGAHTHVVYISNGQGVTSTDNKHSHVVTIIPPQMGINGPSAPQIAIELVDGHTHELIQLPLSDKKPKKKDKEILDETKALYEFSKTLENDSRKKGIESEAFFDGTGQWDEKVKQDLESKQRACLTINEIAPKVDLLSGYQRQNRSDIRYFPVEGGDGRIADILNVVSKNILDQNDYEYEETSVFEDEVIPGRGNIHHYVDYTDNLLGDIKVEHYPWKDCGYGPHEKLDASDCEYLWKSKWFSRAKIEAQWPEKKKEFQAEYDVTFAKEIPSEDGYDKTVELGTIASADWVEVAKKEFRVVTVERKEYEDIPVLVNAEDDFYFNAKFVDGKDIAAAKTIPGITEVKKKTHRLRVTTITAHTVLEDKYDEMTDNFHVIPVYARKKGTSFWGKVEGAKDPQREVNKRHSQTVDILNKVATQGHFYDTETFSTPKDLQDWKKNSSTPGFNQKVSDVNRPPKPSDRVPFPGELVRFSELESQKIKEIFNVNSELLGQGGVSQSGVAMQEQKRQGLIGNEFLFDNLNRGKKKLGKVLVSYIQKTHSPERILRIIEDQNSRKAIEIGKQPYDPARREEILNLLQNADLTKYDVAVAMSNFNPTMRAANFAVWAEMANKRPDIPLPFLIELSDLPDKDKFLQMAMQNQQQRMQEEQGKQQTEIVKTLIAKQGGPGAGIPQG